MLDGVTGLAYHPYRETKKDGILGFGKGLGKGFGSLVFKATAAVVGVPAYTMKGLEAQFEKRYERALKAKILQVRLRQGVTVYGRASQEEKDLVISRWKEMDCSARFGQKDWGKKD